MVVDIKWSSKVQQETNSLFLNDSKNSTIIEEVIKGIKESSPLEEIS